MAQIGALPGQILWLIIGMALLPAPRLSAAEAAPAARPSIFVAPLQGDRRVGMWQPAVGDGLAEMLVTELTKLDKFRVLESTTLESLKDEIKMGEDGWIAPNDKVVKGGWKGADYMLVGKVTRFAAKQNSYGGGGGGWGPFRAPIPLIGGAGVSTSEAEVQIDWHISDAASREIVKAGRGNGKETGTSWGFGNGLGSGFVHEHEFTESALGKAAMKAIGEIVVALKQVELAPGKHTLDQQAAQNEAAAKKDAALAVLRATPGVVQAVMPDFMVVSLGAKHGLKPGDKLSLFEVTEIKNAAGEVVMKDEKLVGEATIQSVQEEKSKVSCGEGVKPKEGWIVRLLGAKP